ncbi:NAD(P)-dependent oxidoreductase [Thermoleptolyngbya sichuanensis XZ-Cy5]|uniref:SDR family oxidoreductase n=1 Tax=Thermoleptolyngbya sichuanensis TaxID=2885951 RepID=UPI00240D89B5|nr:NAD(P)-dependent oxidoreductase [Thermoleptolyngbya sichuanensis]MDG2616304.1 NAD(P)-dependent oxidoreductase [Thermoleptolyngbya sichuanensis XZ-Cy5]
MSTPPKTLLITGISGFLGWHIYQATRASWTVYGTYQTRPVSFADANTLALDLTDCTALQQAFQEIRPDAVIHTAALSQPNACQTQPELSRQINVLASLNLASLCADAGIPFAFTSTDLVFDGHHAPYREADPVCPLSLYGEQKAEAEAGILSRYPKAAVCRMPLMFGAAPTAHSFLQPFLQKLRDGEALRLFTDEFRTPISGRDAAKGLLMALDKVQGLVHLGGPERLSRYEFGLRMAAAFDLSLDSISPCKQADVPMPAPRPLDVSMDSSYAFSLGYAPGGVLEELRALA